MSRYIRSAKGEVVDFELLAIKAQLAATPVPKSVAERKAAIDAKDGVKPAVNAALSEMLTAAAQTATTTRSRAVKTK